MILPGNIYMTFALAVVGLLCLGSWANLFKKEQDWRFEIFYFDFAFGAVLMSLLLGMTFGNFGFDGFTFFDDILHAGRRQEVYALFGGVALNLGTMLMLGALTISGFALAFPTSMGLATAVALTAGYLIAPRGNIVLLFTGIALLVVAVIVNVVAYQQHAQYQRMERMKAGQTKSLRKRSVGVKGSVLSIAAGVLMGAAFPILQLASFRDVENELGLGPYALGFLMALSVMFSSFVFNLLFMNVPVDGRPVEIFDYLRTKARRHVLGLAAGCIWCAGMVAGFVSFTAQLNARVAPQTLFSILQASMILAALWGLFLWREYGNATGRVKAAIWVALVLTGIGLTLTSTSGPVARPEVISVTPKAF